MMRKPEFLAALLGAFFFAARCPADEFSSKGVTLHYQVEGKGEPVILVHGLLSSAALNWELPGTIRALSSQYKVIALDCRGHGSSGKPAEDSQYGLEMVEDLARLLDHLQIEKAHVVGYSMGGMITLKFVVLHPDRVRSAILGGMGWLKSGSPLERFWDRVPSQEENRAPAACMHGLGRLGISEAELKAVQVPVSIIVGDRDPCRKLYVEPLLRVRPEWRLTTIEGSGHFSCVLKDTFREALKADLGAHAGK